MATHSHGHTHHLGSEDDIASRRNLLPFLSSLHFNLVRLSPFNLVRLPGGSSFRLFQFASHHSIKVGSCCADATCHTATAATSHLSPHADTLLTRASLNTTSTTTTFSRRQHSTIPFPPVSRPRARLSAPVVRLSGRPASASCLAVQHSSPESRFPAHPPTPVAILNDDLSSDHYYLRLVPSTEFPEQAYTMETADMLETQHYMDVMSDHPKKRGRDDEQELHMGVSSFSEHRNVSIFSECLTSC